MRARTTWNAEQILQRTSATVRTADPYAMNQDHIKQQPAADAYLTGDPSAFAEDITTPNNWNPEYSGGQVKRDEIGLPEVRPDTYNHPEKTAAVNQEVVLKKANIAASIARRMLGANAPEAAVEDQAAALMHLPDQELVNTANRLAGEMPPALKQHMEEKKDQGQQSAKKEEAGQDQGQQEQAKQAAIAAIQSGDATKLASALAALFSKKGNDPQQAPMQQQAQGQQQAPAQQQAGQQQQSGQEQQSAWYDSKGQRPGHQGPDTGPYAGQQQQGQQQMPMQQQAQPQQAPVQQQGGQQQFPGGQQWGDGGQQQQAGGAPGLTDPTAPSPHLQQAGQGQQQAIEAQVQQMIQQAAQQQVAKQANGQQQQAPMQQQGQQQMPTQQAQQQMPMQQQGGQQQQAQCGPMQQQAAPQQQMPMQQQAAPQQQVVQASDDQLIDQMLMGPGQSAAPSGAPIAEMDIQMEAPNMDIGDIQFAPGEDAMLKQLFASGDEAMAAQAAQDAQQGQQQDQGQVQANLHGVRTAAVSRTYGTRPTVGVPRIGGAGAPQGRSADNDVNKLSAMWQTAPDVREAFGLKT